MTDVLQKHINAVRNERSKKFQPLQNVAITMGDQHRFARIKLKKSQNERQIKEDQQRRERFSTWFKGVIARITGRHRRIQEENRQDLLKCRTSDDADKQALITKQLQERGRLQDKIQSVRQDYNETILQMRNDIGTYMDMKAQNSTEPAQFKLEQHDSGYAQE